MIVISREEAVCLFYAVPYNEDNVRKYGKIILQDQNIDPNIFTQTLTPEQLLFFHNLHENHRKAIRPALVACCDFFPCFLAVEHRLRVRHLANFFDEEQQQQHQEELLVEVEATIWKTLKYALPETPRNQDFYAQLLFTRIGLK
ncbi:unnamed protein product [Mucor hiemalis]